MANISTMIHPKAAGSPTLFHPTGRPATLNIYWTGPSYDRSAGSINNCSLDLEDNNGSVLLQATGRVMT
ncbi:hypothetical protein EFQ99_23370 [Rhizobium vallis]|uniref:Uncharacterized protein n=1 Tax=Rhizobium vallis TaxID=634290 RepID=A0A432PFG8_9HYPH|nr:hypothetical protein EFQ99_23370 [Rhizobium vallis]